MTTLLDKLDLLAQNWLGNFDSQLQQPIIRAMTGEVFTHGTVGHTNQEPQPTHDAETTEHTEYGVVLPPALRKAKPLF